MIDAVRDFLTLALRGDAPDLARLARALDALAFAYHSTPSGEPSESEDEPPSRDSDALRRLLESRFPDFGFYAVADLSEPPGEETTLGGDAIDDLADIVGDLEGVAWRWEHLGRDDANWHFRFDYETHWGRHLHDLRSYFHAVQFEGDPPEGRFGPPNEQELRTRVAGGDVRAAYLLGELLVHRFENAEEGLPFLKLAFKGGVRQAGYALASLPGHMDQRLSGLSLSERLSLLEEAALGGDPGAALDLAHMPGNPLERERLIRVLKATERHSAEAGEILRSLGEGEGTIETVSGPH